MSPPSSYCDYSTKFSLFYVECALTSFVDYHIDGIFSHLIFLDVYGDVLTVPGMHNCLNILLYIFNKCFSVKKRIRS